MYDTHHLSPFLYLSMIFLLPHSIVEERTLQKKNGLRKVSEYYGGSKGSKGSYGGYEVHEGGHHMSMELNLNHFETEYEGKSGKGSESGYGYGSKGSKGSYGGYEHEGGSYHHAGGDHSGLIEVSESGGSLCEQILKIYVSHALNSSHYPLPLPKPAVLHPRMRELPSPHAFLRSWL